MSRDAAELHHDLRDALSAVQMNLQTLEALESGGEDVPVQKRIAILARAKVAVAEAVAVADRLRAERQDPAPDR